MAHQRGDDVHRLLRVIRRPIPRINARKHERAQFHQRIPHVRLHHDCIAVCRSADNARDHISNAFAVRHAQLSERVYGQLLPRQHAAANRVVDIMVEIGNSIRQMNALSLQRLRPDLAGMMFDAVAHFPRQVQPRAVVF